MIQGTDIQTHASDILDTADRLLDAVNAKLREDEDFEEKNEEFVEWLDRCANLAFTILMHLEGEYFAPGTDVCAKLRELTKDWGKEKN